MNLRGVPSHAVATGRSGETYALIAAPVDPLSYLDDVELSLSKLDRQGGEQWRIKLGDLHLHVPAPWPIAVASNGDVVVAGALEGTIERGGVRLASPVPSFPVEPVPYVMRLAPDGGLRWARRLPHEGAAVTTGLVLAPNGTAYVAVTSAEGVQPRDGLGAVYAVDAAGRASLTRSFPGQLRGLALLPDGNLALAGSGKGPNPPAFIGVMSPAGRLGETIRIAPDVRSSSRPHLYDDEPTALAVAATPSGELWALLSSAYAPGLNVETEPDGEDPSHLLVKITPSLSRVTSAFQLAHLLYGRPDSLAAVADGSVLVGHTNARWLVRSQRNSPESGWFTRLATADGRLLRVPSIHCNEGLLGHADVAAALTAQARSPVAGLRICLRPCDELCRAYGWCAYRASPDDASECVAASAGDCAASSDCRSLGACSLVDGLCIPSSAADCRASTGCRSGGSCALVDSKCVPATDQDCRRSRACRDEGRCAFTEEPSSSPSAAGPRCVADSDAACRRARICREEGRCHAPRDGDECEARSAQDCQRSAVCARTGRCSPDPRPSLFLPASCLALTDGDCQRSPICRKRGACSLENQTPDAAQQPGTALITACRRQSSADCRRTDACKLHGKCRLVDRQCVE